MVYSKNVKNLHAIQDTQLATECLKHSWLMSDGSLLEFSVSTGVDGGQLALTRGAQRFERFTPTWPSGGRCAEGGSKVRPGRRRCGPGGAPKTEDAVLSIMLRHLITVFSWKSWPLMNIKRIKS